MNRQYIYGTAQIHLFAEARRGVSLPLRVSICTPVRFRNRPGEFWSLWIVPEEPLYPCQWGQAKVAVLVQEYSQVLMEEAASFEIWFGGEIGGEGVIMEVHTCDEGLYQQTFQFGKRLEDG